MKLTKYQKTALGHFTDIPQYILNQTSFKQYQTIDNRNLQLQDEGQTYQQFVDMQKLEPNQEGTGRYKFNYFNKMQYTFITKGTQAIPQKIINSVNKLINNYLGFEVSLKHKLNLNVKGNEITDKHKKIVYSVRKEHNGLNVHDLLDILMEYREQKTILLAFVENQLQQQGDSVDGRACGDGVAVVSFTKQDFSKNLQLFLQTTLHQTLHTLGFDHCIAWKCLMNAFTNFQSWLCPVCSRKLYYERNFTSVEYVKKWMMETVNILEELSAFKSCKKGRALLNSFK